MAPARTMTAKEATARISHVPALDGLRGLALAGVLAFHADGLLVGGYLGVDLFFVLSGFLITALLLAEHDATNAIDLRRFWLRRARRLLPALLVVLFAVVIGARLTTPEAAYHDVCGDALATLGYFANWRAVLSDKTYWELFTTPSPLEHTWSLAIEEQFYLVWPLAAWACLRLGGRRALLVFTAIGAAASVAAMIFLYNPERSTRVYFGTDTRAAAILVGALFALVSKGPSAPRTRRGIILLDVIGAAALVISAIAWATIKGEDTILYRGGFWVTEIAAVALIACAIAGPRSLVARLLAVRPLRALGAVSYGAYLWHWPVHVALSPERLDLPAWAIEALRLGVTLVFTLLSYYFIEIPIREQKLRFARPARALVAASFAVVLVVAGVTYARPRPSPGPRVELQPEPPPPGTKIRLRVAVYGDSTANSLGWTLRGLHDPEVVISLEGEDGFNLITRQMRPWAPADVDVKIIAFGGAFLYGIHVDGRWTEACHPEWTRHFEENLQASLAGRDFTRTFLATVPYPVGRYDKRSYRDQVDCINRSIRAAAARHPTLKLLELGEIICPEGVCKRSLDGIAVRPDGVHFDIDGSRAIAGEILRRIEHPE